MKQLRLKNGYLEVIDGQTVGLSLPKCNNNRKGKETIMLSSMEMAKRFLGEKIFTQILSYLRNDPLNNMSRALDLLCRAAILPEHREKIRQLKTSFETSPVMKQYFARIISSVDENVQQHLILNFFVNASLIGVPKQKKMSEKLGYNIPYTILIDPTSACNLRCQGCWAGAYERCHTMSFEEVDRLVEEAKELGMYFIAMSGGEPFLWPHLFELANKHRDVAFMLYTNGTLIDETVARKLKEAGNISPAISLEGGREATDWRRGKGVFDKIMAAMDHLKENGVVFGISLTITSRNWQDVYSDEFIEMIIDKGAIYGWSFHYIPIGSNPDFSLMLTPEQRAWLIDRVQYIRKTKLIQMADFWNDGHLTGGCIAGGRRYFHITANGNVEPCAFVHFSIDNIHGKSLKEILANPLFNAYQKRQPFNDNLLRPCPLIDVPEALRDIIAETQALPTHEGADSVLSGEHARQMDRIAEAWRQTADQRQQEHLPV